MSYIEIMENDECILRGCLGQYIWAFEGGGCSCHINPPCGYCTSSYLVCDECGNTPEEAAMVDEIVDVEEIIIIEDEF